MNDLSSPLQMIRQKELALRRRVEQAQRAADEQLAVVRCEISQAIKEADRIGRTEAERLYHQGVTEAKVEAEAMVVAAQTEAQTLQALVSKRLVGVADWITALILDLPADEVSRRDR